MYRMCTAVSLCMCCILGHRPPKGSTWDQIFRKQNRRPIFSSGSARYHPTYAEVLFGAIPSKMLESSTISVTPVYRMYTIAPLCVFFKVVWCNMRGRADILKTVLDNDHYNEYKIGPTLCIDRSISGCKE